MPFVVDTSDAPTFIRITLQGEWPTIEEQRALRLQLIGDGSLTARTRALIDLRYVATIPSYSEAASIVEAAVSDGGLPQVRAYLVGSAEQYGFVRQFKIAAGARGVLEIFTNEQEAIVWLVNA